MNLLNKLRHALLGKSQPKVTRLEVPDRGGMRIDELPPFTLKTADLMRYDPQVRIGLGARNGLLMAAQVEVVGPTSNVQSPRSGSKDPHPAAASGSHPLPAGEGVRATVSGGEARVVHWVQHQWDALWHSAAHQLLRAKLYGFLPFEVVYRRAAGGPFDGLIEVERLIDYHPRDTRLLMAGDKVVGFSYEGGAKSGVAVGRAANHGDTGRTAGVAYGTPSHPLASSEPTNLFAPQSLVVTFDAECGNPYGCALLARAYPAWFEKWMEGGAKRTLRLRMIKDAYIGELAKYIPPLA